MSDSSTFPFTEPTGRRPRDSDASSLPAKLARLADGQHRASHISPVMVRSAIRLIEFLVIALTGMLIAVSYVTQPPVMYDVRYLTSFLAVSAFTVVTFELMGLYTPRAFATYIRQLPRLIAGWTLALAIYSSAVFFLKVGAEFSRVWLLVWFVAGGILLLAGRGVLAAIVAKWAREGRLFRRAVIYGISDITESVIAELEADGDSDIRITGVFDDRSDDRSQHRLKGLPRLGQLEELVELCRETRVDLVIVALPVTAEARLAEVVKKLSVLPADIKLPARATTIRFSPHTYSHVGSVAMIDLYDKPIANWNTVSKSLFDKIVGGLALLLFAPVMLGVAFTIKATSSGPILFRQKRYGFNNELIEVFKFRSMYMDRCDANADTLVSRQDPRVTPVGRFIRKTSLDELPQLFNVLNGTLSLVGPRPHAVKAKAANQLYDHAVEGYFARHKVKPGITGWAQINGWRGETDTTEKIKNRVAHDLYYIENWSLLFDLYILIKTPAALFRSNNAY